MAGFLFPFVYLRDARLAGHATSPAPAWLWQPDGRRISWANAAAAELFGAASPHALTERPFDPDNPIVCQFAELADTLPANGSPRLIPLVLPGSDQTQGSTYLCQRLTLDDATPAILVVAAEPGRSKQPLAERVRRLLADTDAPVAAFAPDGSLLHATDAAADRMGSSRTLASLGACALAKEALAEGHAEGGMLRLDRIGRDRTVVLLASFAPTPIEPVATASAGPATPATESESEPATNASRDTACEHRQPLRFVWQMDQDGRFTIASDAFTSLIGPESAAVLGQRWIDIARHLQLDPDEQISRAIDTRETWSGIVIRWPVAGTNERLTVEFSGLPMFDRERNFLGYRGFGVCRDAERFIGRADTAQTIVPFRSARTDAVQAPALSPIERTAFHEIGRELSARLKGEEGQAADSIIVTSEPDARAAAHEPGATRAEDGVRELLDRLPIGVLIYRVDMPIYANRAFLKWTGHADIDAFIAAGGLDHLFLESDINGANGEPKRLTLTSGSDSEVAECRLLSIVWEGERAHALAVVPAESRSDDLELRRVRRRTRELRAIVDLATDGVAIIDGEGAIVRLNARAQALFGRDTEAVAGQSFADLLAPEDRADAATDFAALASDGETRCAGREVNGRLRDGGSIALFMTLGRLASDQPTFCAVFRDISRWKRTEQELIAAKRQAEQASQAKSDFLAKISHEIRTPLNAIIGFSEVMMEERLGPIENERYRAYLKDVHASGEHLVALLNDLLDLSKIEAGKLELTFGSVNLNEVTQQCVALMQPQANRGRIIIRTSLAPVLPPIVADARSVRQILLNLLSNSIKFTDAGGQVIVSTAVTERCEAVLRVRDTGIGMSETELETALEPFRQIETATRAGSGGTGLGLPLTKALAEANRAVFAIKSNVNSGTLVEVAFPTARAAE
jgi:PAS domain S-box-containing protein